MGNKESHDLNDQSSQVPCDYTHVSLCLALSCKTRSNVFFFVNMGLRNIGPKVLNRTISGLFCSSKLCSSIRLCLQRKILTGDVMSTLCALHEFNFSWFYLCLTELRQPPFQQLKCIKYSPEENLDFAEKNLVCSLKHLKFSGNRILLWSHLSRFILASSRSCEFQKQFTCTYIMSPFPPLCSEKIFKTFLNSITIFTGIYGLPCKNMNQHFSKHIDKFSVSNIQQTNLGEKKGFFNKLCFKPCL